MKPRNMAIALAFCASLVSTSYAQPIPKARERRLEAVAKQLHLTREQEKQLVPILRAEEPKLQAIKNDQSLSRAEKLQQLRAVHDASNPQVKEILTSAQYQQLQAIRRQRRAQLMAQAAKGNLHQGGAARSLTPPRAQQK
jgi:Spy/CpxP family protein refolding chaperone